MDRKNTIKLLEDMLDVDSGFLSEYMLLKDLEEWDSMANLALFALADEHFGKSINAEIVRSFVSISDVIDYLCKK